MPSISSPADSLMPAENPYLPAVDLSYKIRCKSRWCNSCNSNGGLWPFTFTQNVHPVEGCFFPVKFPEFSCSPFAIHRHQSSIAKASDLRRKYIPWKKWETIWKGRELKNKNLAPPFGSSASYFDLGLFLKELFTGGKCLCFYQLADIDFTKTSKRCPTTETSSSEKKKPQICRVDVVHCGFLN